MLCIDTLSKLVLCWGFNSHRMVVGDSCLSMFEWWPKECHAKGIHPVGCSTYCHDFITCFDHATCFQTSQTVISYILTPVDTSACLLLKIAMKSITKSNSNANMCAVAVVHARSMEAGGIKILLNLKFPWSSQVMEQQTNISLMYIWLYFFFQIFGDRIYFPPCCKQLWPARLTPATHMNFWLATSVKSCMMTAATKPSSWHATTHFAWTAWRNSVKRAPTQPLSTAPTAVCLQLSHKMEWKDYRVTFTLQVYKKFPAPLSHKEVMAAFMVATNIACSHNPTSVWLVEYPSAATAQHGTIKLKMDILSSGSQKQKLPMFRNWMLPQSLWI